MPPADRLPPGVSILIHTRNAAETLDRALASTAWADEHIVVDMRSEDRTRDLAAARGARVLDCSPHPCVDEVRNRFLDQAGHAWTLVLDSDEYLAEDAGPEVRRLIEEARDYDAVALPRFNYIAGRVMRSCGWYPDPQIRLFRTGTVRWQTGHHHPPRVLSGEDRILRLTPPDCLHLHHLNYRDFTSVIQRQLAYAVSDQYRPTEDAFAFHEYLAGAYQAFAQRHDRFEEGDFATALATIMAWDQVIRGLIHWDRLERRPRLQPAFSLPVLLHQPPPGQQERIDELTGALEAAHARRMEAESMLASLQSTRWCRLIQRLDRRFPRVMRALSAIARRVFG